MQLFTALGYEAGYSDSEVLLSRNVALGSKKTFVNCTPPYIVKTPYLCDYLDETMRAGLGTIDHAFVPMGNLFSAAESHRVLSRKYPGAAPGTMAGGVWDTSVRQQENVLVRKLYDLVYAIALWNIPLTCSIFLGSWKEPAYLYEKLRPVFPNLPFETYSEQFLRAAKPQFVHSYGKSRDS